MWFLLATSLLALSFQRLLALVLLLATCCLAFYDGVLAPPAVAALAALGVLALLRRRLAARRAWALGLELLLVAGAVGLFLHLLPGFANPRILDKAVVGPQSLPFTMYFNFDKALVPFLLLACLPSLFRDEARAPGRPWYGRVTSPPREPAPGPLVSSTGAVYGGAFGSARGKLPWPVNGRVVARFGSQRGDDPRAKWDGVLISASAGSTVRAVHGGRVVFADWLRGAGLLVILDHGGGYLSLYGHNQSLLKDAGDTVKAGDPIATVGTSGGQSSPAVYFAIRHQGRPADPTTWCRAQG